MTFCGYIGSSSRVELGLIEYFDPSLAAETGFDRTLIEPPITLAMPSPRVLHYPYAGRFALKISHVTCFLIVGYRRMMHLGYFCRGNVHENAALTSWRHQINLVDWRS